MQRLSDLSFENLPPVMKVISQKLSSSRSLKKDSRSCCCFAGCWICIIRMCISEHCPTEKKMFERIKYDQVHFERNIISRMYRFKRKILTQMGRKRDEIYSRHHIWKLLKINIDKHFKCCRKYFKIAASYRLKKLHR